MMTNEIDRFFDMEVEKCTSEGELTIFDHSDVVTNTTSDYEQTRESLKTMIQTGGSLIDSMVKVAKESESPRAYEVVGGYLKQIAELGETLMKLNKEAKDILNVTPDNQNSDGVDVAYVGSTENLQDYLNTKGKE